MKEKIAELEQEIHERQAVEAEQEERIAELLSAKSALEKQGEEIARLAEDLARISQGRRCIGAKNLIKSFCNKELSDSGVATDANRL